MQEGNNALEQVNGSAVATSGREVQSETVSPVVAEAVSESGIRKYAHGEAYEGTGKPSDDLLADPVGNDWWQYKSGQFKARKRRAQTAGSTKAVSERSFAKLSPEGRSKLIETLRSLDETCTKEEGDLEQLRGLMISPTALKKYLSELERCKTARPATRTSTATEGGV